MTSPSPLERHADLTKEPPDAKEFEGLVRTGLARLRDAGRQENSLDEGVGESTRGFSDP